MKGLHDVLPTAPQWGHVAPEAEALLRDTVDGSQNPAISTKDDVFSPLFIGFSTIPGGLAGFLNHQPVLRDD